MLIAMTDETLRERFVRQDSTLVQAFPTPEALAEGISLIWLHALGLGHAAACCPSVSAAGIPSTR